MRFAIDAHAIGRRQTGNEVYIRNLLQHFPRLDPDSEFVAYIAEPAARRDLPAPVGTNRVASNPWRRLGLDLPVRLSLHQPDLLHVQYTAPLSRKAPIVATVHDVSFLDCPQHSHPLRALQLRTTVRRTVEAAARIITVSEFSRRRILKHYPLDPSKVVAIPNGVSAAFRPVDRATAARRLAEKFGIHAPFVLTVGDLRPRKNHRNLIAAFENVIRAHPSLPHHLVCVGQETGGAITRRAARDRVRFTGYVSDANLLDFYGACDLFAFPSLYEGFGLPILEAMACGRSVACSNTSAMPEVAGSAAIYFDPHSIPEISRAISQVLLDVNFRVVLERRGLDRARAFRWESSARRTLDVYHEIAAASRKYAHADRFLLSAASR
jgi:glycosyltransferase involved in cell wall biosynthesis